MKQLYNIILCVYYRIQPYGNILSEYFISSVCFPQEACIVVAALLHYFLLATFCWMLCEGIKLLMLLVFVFYKGFLQRMHFFMIIGWGK